MATNPESTGANFLFLNHALVTSNCYVTEVTRYSGLCTYNFPIGNDEIIDLTCCTHSFPVCGVELSGNDNVSLAGLSSMIYLLRRVSSIRKVFANSAGFCFINCRNSLFDVTLSG